MKKDKLGLKGLLEKATAILQSLRRFSLIIFLVFVALLYGFVLLRINNLSSMQPTTNAVNSQVKAKQIPHINQTVLKQLQSLQDNSVSVKALFDQARSNPFQ